MGERLDTLQANPSLLVPAGGVAGVWRRNTSRATALDRAERRYQNLLIRRLSVCLLPSSLLAITSH